LVRTNRLKTGRPSLPGLLDWIICCRRACISCCFLYCDLIWGGTLGLPFFMSRNLAPPAAAFDDDSDDGAHTTTDPPNDDTRDDACSCCWVVQAVTTAARRLTDTSRFNISPCFRIMQLFHQGEGEDEGGGDSGEVEQSSIHSAG
jgi:hypothetical protein